MFSGVEVNAGSHGYHLYSCGDGNILEHLPKKLDNEALSIGQLIQTSNPAYRVNIICLLFSAYYC